MHLGTTVSNLATQFSMEMVATSTVAILAAAVSEGQNGPKWPFWAAKAQGTQVWLENGYARD